MIRGEDYIPNDARYSWPHEDEADEKALNALVDEFAVAMKAKLLAKKDEGYGGWDDPSLQVALQNKLLHHSRGLFYGDVGQAVDVANLAAMLWNIGRSKS